MSDLTPSDATGQDAGAPASAEGAESTQTAAATVTPEQFQALLEKIERLERRGQSMTDKAVARLRKELGITPARHLTDAARQAGLELPDDKAAALLENLRARGLVPADGPEEPEEGELPEDQATAQDITEQGYALAREVGLTEGDPELGLIIRTGTPEEYLVSIKVAGAAKKARLAGRRNGANPGQMPGLMPAGGPAPKDRTKINRDQALLSEWNKVGRKG